jgi:DNA-binding transcriptional LysR family regulator
MNADKGPLNVRALEAFRAVMRTGSMTGAARIIHTTQPNVSRLVSMLEAELDLKLFVREGNKLHVTDEGVAFFKEVEQHYAGLRALKDAARMIKQIGGGRLHIAVAPALSHGFLASVVAVFTQRHPQVALSIRTCNSYMVEQLVSSQLCDLGLAAFVGYAAEPGLESERVASIRGVCLLHRDHRLACRDVIHAPDLEGEPFISIARQNGTREHVDSLFEQAKVTRRIDIEAENASTICHLVAQGLGVSVLNEVIVDDFLGHGLVVREFRPPIHFPITLLRSSHRPRSLLVTAFIECLGTVLKSRFAQSSSASCER